MKLIIYNSIEEKSVIESKMFKALSPHESLIQSLELMDLLSTLRNKEVRLNDGLPWIILKVKTDELEDRGNLQ